MKVGDSVMMLPIGDGPAWRRVGLVLEFSRHMVLVFWGEDFPCEEEYREQLEVV
jgi:hypothetical protein